MKATVARRTNRRSSGPVAVLSSHGPAVASSVIVAAVWGMRAGLATLVVGLAFPIYYRLAAGRGLKATPIGDHEAETADALQIPVGTAKSRLHYALEALRAALAADERATLGTAREDRTA